MITTITAFLIVFVNVELLFTQEEITDVYSLGKILGNHPVIIKFNSPRHVKSIFMKINKFEEINLTIANDRSKEERERREKAIT